MQWSKNALERWNSGISYGFTLIKVNCAALAPESIESELFGNEKGAAKLPGMKRTTLESCMKKLGINRSN